MYERRFTTWAPWHERNDLSGVAYPGVYAIAHSKVDLAGRYFSWRRDIIYVGMTNAVAGLAGRLKQFDNTIRGKRGHGGADRVRYKHRNYDVLCEDLFVAIAPFKCDAASINPDDLRKLGAVAQFEFSCFAHFVELYARLPEFNDKKGTLKFSLTEGRALK